MDNTKAARSIPKQRKGAKSDTVCSKRYETREAALTAFQVAKNKLLDVSRWAQFAGAQGADFKLTDSEGNPLTRAVAKGDYFRINIPGPGSKAGRGFDWVNVLSVEEDEDELNDNQIVSIKVRPSSAPKETTGETAHFLDKDATSTFIVKREQLTIRAEVHGRNEKPNTDAKNIFDKIRNLFVALGAFLGFSKAQWTFLVRGLVEP